MERCPVCKIRMWNPSTHTCANRWVAVITDDRPKTPFVWSNYGCFTDLFSTDAQGVAEEAAERFNYDQVEYHSHRTVGVMSYDDYRDWFYSAENEEDFMDPNKLTWFDVSCEMVPSYSSRQLR